ncbi:MAG: ribosome maturation factor RimP [Bacteroidota bacterium]
MPHNPPVQPHVAAAQAENADLRSRLRALADEIAEDAGFYVVEVQVRGQKGSRIIEVFVDGDAGIGTDDLARVSRSLAFLLDTEDLVRGKYHLNVSSPGADSPLRLLRQYPQHYGRTLAVRYAVDGEEANALGALVGVGPQSITIEAGDGSSTEIPFADVTDARVQLPW